MTKFDDRRPAAKIEHEALVGAPAAGSGSAQAPRRIGATSAVRGDLAGQRVGGEDVLAAARKPLLGQRHRAIIRS